MVMYFSRCMAFLFVNWLESLNLIQIPNHSYDYWFVSCKYIYAISMFYDASITEWLYTSMAPNSAIDTWASCKIRKIAGAHAPGMPGTFSPPPEASDTDMHHDTCVSHVPWCMPGSLTSGFLWSRRRGKTFPAFPVHAQPAMLRIW